MAEDRWESALYEASWGDLRLDVLSTSDDVGRAIAKYKYPRRDGADTDDMGGELRTTRARVIFTGPDYDDRLQSFLALKDSGEPWPFVHPVFGQYEARVEECTVDVGAEPRDTAIVSCTFVEATTEVAVFLPGPGAAVSAGPEEVWVSAAELAEGLLVCGVTSSVGDEAGAAADGWAAAAAAGTADARAVELELIRVSNKIAAELERLEVATDVTRWPLFSALTKLHYNLRRAAEAVTETTPRLIEIVVLEPTPLVVVCTRTYGAVEAMTRFDQLMKLNDIRNPARIEAGTRLRAQAPGGGRRRLRSPL